jgi:surface protein
MPIMTVNMSSTDNIISNNSGTTSQITTHFADITVINNTTYRFGFLPLGITNRNQAWIQIGTINIWGGTLTRYTCSLENLVSSVRINNIIGRFSLRATTRESVRYNSITIPSSILTDTTRRQPVIAFPASFIETVTFGQTYQLNQAVFTYPSTPPSGVTISYSIPRELQFPIDSRNANNVANIINGTTVRINNVGTFRIRAETNSNNLFDSVFFYSPIVTINPDTPRFQTTPPWNAFPTNTANVAIGTQLIITPPVLEYPSLELRQQNGFSIVYVINFINSSITTSVLTITPMVAGNFTVTAETRSNTNYIVARVTSVHTISVFNPTPPRIVLNGETLVFQEASIPQSPIFIQASPRGPLEWFAVVDDRSRQQITNYARAQDNSTFRHPPPPDQPGAQTVLVPFNNIVTTLMTDMSILFDNCPFFNQDISSWDTSRVTNMAAMFRGATIFNQRLESWNTAQVVSMSEMFDGAVAFNQPLLGWNTSSVRFMQFMFRRATNFRQNISSWNTTAVTSMEFMFADAQSFTGPIIWNTRNVRSMAAMFMNAISYRDHLHMYTDNVTNMNGMFQNATSFPGFGNIWAWNTSRVTDMGNMFQSARAFNHHIGMWNTSQVMNMAGMFGFAISYNQNMSWWNTTRVTNMQQMFDHAERFNQPINTLGAFIGESGNEWNTGSVTNMSWMFRNARNFNQSLSRWNTSQVTDMQHMFEGATNFNNGIWPPVFGFNGFLNGQEFVVNAPIFITFAGVPTVTTRLPNPRQTMNWEVRQVRNFTFMFDGASNFINTDISRWNVLAPAPLGFRRNCPLSDLFTPLGIRINAFINGGR